MSVICRSCDAVKEGVFTLTPELKHYGKWSCESCGSMIKWEPMPQHKGQRLRTSKYTPEGLEKDCCELCRRTKPMLGNNQSFEIHHKDRNAEHDIPDNLLVLCTPCHKQVHFNATYYNDHYISKNPDPPCPEREEFFEYVRNL